MTDDKHWSYGFGLMWSILGRQVYCCMCGKGLGDEYEATHNDMPVAPIGGIGYGAYVAPHYKLVYLCRVNKERDCGRAYAYKFGSWSYK